MAADRDDDRYAPGRNLFWERPEDDEPLELLPLPAYPAPEEADAQRFVQELFRQPLLGESAPPPPAPTLRGAATELLRFSGLFGDAPAPDASTSAGANTPFGGDGKHRPPSWKLPSRGTPPTILGDDTAAGPAQGAVPNIESVLTASDLPGAASSAAAPRQPAAPGASSPLDHPDAQAGLALTAADAVLTKGIDLAVNLAGGDPAVARKLVEIGANALAGVLPEPFRASALTSAGAAAAEAERRIGENSRATRTRAALGTLANRRAQAEQDHAAAVISGERSKIEAARRDALDAWRAERRARGDGEAEINAAARALDAQYRKTALRHRLAQMDGANIHRALDEDDDAKADPALAREAADDILRLRRDDPARVAEASIERKIAEKKRDGRIDTPAEEQRERYRLRLEAQAQRGIPEPQRQLLTNAERTTIAAKYLQLESSQGKGAADKWLDEQARRAGLHANRFKAELTAPQAARATFESPIQTSKTPVAATGLEGAAPTQETNVVPRPQQQYAETPGRAASDVPAEAPGTATDDDSSSPIQQRSDEGGHREQVRPEDRRQPEPPISSYSVGAELGVPHPTSPLRELRKLIGGIRSVAAFKDDGTPTMSDQNVAAYVDEARKHLRPEYQDIFEVTVLAVRAGMIPWWRAHERLRDYFAPESTGEALLDGILDFIPIVGQVKGAIEAGEALDGLRIALDEGDQAGAAKFAADAALLIAGLVPILKVGKFAKHVPGLEKLKDVLGEFAGGRLPFHEFLEKWNKNWKLQGHHSFPIFLGGSKREGIAKLRTSVHHRLHHDLNIFLEKIVGRDGKHMRPIRSNKGALIRERFSLSNRVQAMAEFYNGPGNKLRYRNARREFFTLFPELAR